MSSRQQRRAAERAAAKEARRAEINHQNSQHSTGPRSEAGKANSSKNSFKHGLYSKQLCIDLEEVAELDALKADLRAEHQPGTQTEEILVNELAEQYWRIKRARRLETQLLMDGNAACLAQLAAVQRMMSAAERGFHKALTALRQLQAGRGFVPQNTESVESKEGAAGFVSQNESGLPFEPDPLADFSPFSRPSAPHFGPRVTAALEHITQARPEALGFVPQNPA